MLADPSSLPSAQGSELVPLQLRLQALGQARGAQQHALAAAQSASLAKIAVALGEQEAAESTCQVSGRCIQVDFILYANPSMPNGFVRK